MSLFSIALRNLWRRPVQSILTACGLAFGLTFEMPIATFFLTRMGLVTHVTLLQKGRYAVLVMFVVAAILTPPDAVSQMLMVLPLLLLYLLSIGVAWAFGRDRKADTDNSDTGNDD